VRGYIEAIAMERRGFAAPVARPTPNRKERQNMMRHVCALGLCAVLGAEQAPAVSEWDRLREAGRAAFHGQNYGEAERLYGEALRMAERTWPGDIRMARSLAEYGIMRTMAGECEDGARIGVRSVRMYETAGVVDPAEAARAWLNLGRSYYCAGLYSNSERALERGLALAESAPIDARREMAEILASLVAVHQRRNNDRAAMEAAERAASVAARAGLDAKTRTLLLNNLGTIYHGAGRRVDAQKTLAEALATADGIPGGREPGRFYVLSNLGSLAIDNRQYREAEARLSEALGLLDAGASVPAGDLQNFLRSYSACLAKLGRKNEVKRVLARAAALQRQSPQSGAAGWTTGLRELQSAK
jgi:tetratricopeptide (TPR) repeat protein